MTDQEGGTFGCSSSTNIQLKTKKLASLVTSIFGHWMALFCFPSDGRNALWRGRVRFLRRLSQMCALHRHAAGTACSACKKYLCLLGNCSYLITVLLFNVLVKLFNSDFGGSGTSKRGYSKKVVKWQTWVSYAGGSGKAYKRRALSPDSLH